MPDHFRTEAMYHQFKIIEVKDMDGDMLIESPDWGDNILAILTRAGQP